VDEGQVRKLALFLGVMLVLMGAALIGCAGVPDHGATPQIFAGIVAITAGILGGVASAVRPD
jgi:hypothetical protein